MVEAFTVHLFLFKEDLLSFIDVRALKTKHEEQFKYEVRCNYFYRFIIIIFIQGKRDILEQTE